MKKFPNNNPSLCLFQKSSICIGKTNQYYNILCNHVLLKNKNCRNVVNTENISSLVF